MTSILSVEQNEKTPSPLVVLSSTSVGWSSSMSYNKIWLFEVLYKSKSKKGMMEIDQHVKVKLVLLSSTSVGWSSSINCDTIFF